MKKVNQFTNLLALMLSVSILLSSCIQGTPSARKGSSLSNLTGKNGTGTGAGAINPATTPTPTPTPNPALMTQKVELSHLVDPFDGTYKKKLTLPKNFKGNLYIAGLNVASLASKIVSVRFNFGVDKQSITLGATIARAPGIVPKTDIQVIVVDMNAKPFNNMRLAYDLYDYNDYYTDPAHPTTPTQEMVSDARDGGLYCRGLKLEDDPTFQPLSNVSTCSGATDRCLYSYAKVTDSTLYTNQIVNSLPYTLSAIPTHSQIWSDSTGVRNPTAASIATTVCLPDDNTNVNSLNLLFGGLNLPALGDNLPILGGFYRGPYRSINDAEWQISGPAVYSSAGLFQTPPSVLSWTTGYHSLLFPRSGKLGLNQGVSYLGSVDYFGPRAQMTSDSTGTTSYVDGCNLRVLNYDPSTSESIGSCNVSATIEVFYMLDGKEVSITSDNSIKLQIIRPSLLNYQGKEVLTTAFKRCDSSATCGSDECCFNSRCWSKDLVTQCVDQTPVIGNQEIGANCSSDFECSSLCCNQSTGSCAPHNPNGTTPIFCNKTAGQQCVSKEFCQQEAVVTCKIVKNGFNADGSVACTLRCPAVLTYGDCRSGTCVPPAQPAVPVFDPKDCSKAVDP